MNIFVTDPSPRESAVLLCDRHIVKMVVETGQILSTAVLYHSPEAEEGLYKATHRNHPCVVWARSRRSSFQWLCTHGIELAMEYQARYGRVHKTLEVIQRASSLSSLIPLSPGLDSFVYCGPEEHLKSNVTESYRTYLSEKYRSWGPKKARWTKATLPGGVSILEAQ